MLIENPEAFKSWLTAVLEPLCDADPAALAKYVFALVKKDKPVEDLRDGMLDQLDVFLQSETKSFVELLFKSLETQEYLKPMAARPPVVENKQSVVAAPSETETVVAATKQIPFEPKEDKKEILPKDKDSDAKAKHGDATSKKETSKQRIVLNRSTKFVPATVPKEKPAYATEQTLVKVIPDLLEDSLNEQLPSRNSKRDRKSDSDKEDRRRRAYKSRSRSRSWDRTRRIAGASRPMWRNRSPPSQANRYERRRSRSGSPPTRAPRYRNRSPPPCSDTDIAANRSRSRSRERAASPGLNPPRDRVDRVSRERERDRQSRNRDKVDRDKPTDREREREDRGRTRDCVSGTATPTQDSNPGDNGTQIRGTTTLAGIFTSALKKRCRDFDEKGYCMRGDLCQYDHGRDPVVLEDALSHMLTLPITRPPPRNPTAEYNPSAPDIWSRGGGGSALYATPPPPYFPFLNAPPHGHHPVQRELIPVPIARAENVPPTNSTLPQVSNNAIRAAHAAGIPLAPVPPPENNNAPPVHMNKKKPFDFNRLGPNRHNSAKSGGGNCSLELKKVPRGLNDILHLNNHFSKFGKIVNIQVCYEDDPEAALITFSSHTEANVAYKSTEAVLNNRFIKVFWHNSDTSKQENSTGGRSMIKERGAATNHLNSNNTNHVSHNKVLINKDTMRHVNNSVDKSQSAVVKDNGTVNDAAKNGGEETIGVANNKDASAVVSLADTTMKPDLPPSSELAAMVRKHGEGTIKLARDLRKRTRMLLEKQLQQQKILLERLDKGNLAEVQKEQLIATIKIVQKSIDKTSKELVLHTKSATPQPEDSFVINSMSNMSLTSNAKSLTAKKAAFGAVKKVPKSKEETQKEILDMELDLITKQQEGQDVTELQKRLAELKRQQLTFNKSHPGRRTIIHRASTRGGRFAKTGPGSKPGMFVNQSVDHRPKSFLVSGYESDELEQLIKHFTQYGEIVEHVSDPTTPSLWLQFKSRKIAEQAATKGRQFNDRTLTVTWQTKSTPAAQSNQDSSNAAEADAFPNSPQYTNMSPSRIGNMENYPFNLPSPIYPSQKSDWKSPTYKFGDSEDEEGIDYDKEEERSWRR